MEHAVLRWDDCDQAAVTNLLSHYGLSINVVDARVDIPGSYWGDDESGLIGSTVYLRSDTPVHSILHEACHAICMGVERRSQLHTDAGGTDQEENAVCYLQILLAASVPGFGSARCCADMDAWGYSFRLGSAQAWFEADAQDAISWLQERLLWPQLQTAAPNAA